jgi:uncharacterized membrane protein YphA (DoxX/SURF4 family)
LLIRIVYGAGLLIDGSHKIRSGVPGHLITGLFTMADGAFLLVGLWTPIAGAGACAIALWQTIFRSESLYQGILFGAIGLALMLVGPGAYSIDARLFGWKRIDLDS